MSSSATPSTWNAVESAIRGEKRSSAHSSRSCGSRPSNSIESSPASRSSIRSIITPLPSLVRARARGRPERTAPPLSCARGLAADQNAELLVGRAVAELAEALAFAPPGQPALDEALDRVVELLRRAPPEHRPGDPRVPATPHRAD